MAKRPSTGIPMFLPLTNDPDTGIGRTVVGPGAGGLFKVNQWSEWRRTISFCPRKSISGKIIIGRINKRSKNSFNSTRAVGGRTIRIYEFATGKELFTAKLKGEV